MNKKQVLSYVSWKINFKTVSFTKEQCNSEIVSIKVENSYRLYQNIIKFYIKVHFKKGKKIH